MDAAVSTRKTLVALTVFLLVLPLGVALNAVPTAPANLTVQVTGSTVSLVWTPSTGEVLGYLLEAGSGSGLSDKARSFGKKRSRGMGSRSERNEICCS